MVEQFFLECDALGGVVHFEGLFAGFWVLDVADVVALQRLAVDG